MRPCRLNFYPGPSAIFGIVFRHSESPIGEADPPLKIVLGAGLEPASLSAYAPQTYVSAIPPPERREGANFPQTATAGKCRVYSSYSCSKFVIEIEITVTEVK